jgi:LPS-assembly lipoprotein
MSSHSLKTGSKRQVKSMGRAFAFLIVGSLSALSAGCGFQPLYGPTASGAALVDVMKTVDIAPVPGRVGQRVRNELIFGTTNGGEAAKPVYRLEIALKESLRNTLVAKTGDPLGQIYELNVEFKLVRVADHKTVLTGYSQASAPYDKAGIGGSVFADVRAQRDAQDRAARTISDDLKTRLAAYLSQAA